MTSYYRMAFRNNPVQTGIFTIFTVNAYWSIRWSPTRKGNENSHKLFINLICWVFTRELFSLSKDEGQILQERPRICFMKYRWSPNHHLYTLRREKSAAKTKILQLEHWDTNITWEIFILTKEFHTQPLILLQKASNSFRHHSSPLHAFPPCRRFQGFSK